LYRTPPSTNLNRRDNSLVSGGVARRVDWENRRGTDIPQDPWYFDPGILAARTHRDQVYSELLEESEYRCQPIPPTEAETTPTMFAEEQQHSGYARAGKDWCWQARAPLLRNVHSRRSRTLRLIPIPRSPIPAILVVVRERAPQPSISLRASGQDHASDKAPASLARSRPRAPMELATFP
jgi:hypothetical protein